MFNLFGQLQLACLALIIACNWVPATAVSQGVKSAILNNDAEQLNHWFDEGRPNQVNQLIDANYYLLEYALTTAAGLRADALSKRCELIHVILERGADVEQQSFLTGNYPLHLAAKLGNSGIVDRLLAANANPNLTGRSRMR